MSDNLVNETTEVADTPPKNQVTLEHLLTFQKAAAATYADQCKDGIDPLRAAYYTGVTDTLGDLIKTLGGISLTIHNAAANDGPLPDNNGGDSQPLPVIDPTDPPPPRRP